VRCFDTLEQAAPFIAQTKGEHVRDKKVKHKGGFPQSSLSARLA